MRFPLGAIFSILSLAAGATSCAPPANRAGPAQEPGVRASEAFWSRWGDGKAELSGYAVREERYGAMRDGRMVLIYVTEPMERRTWVKDDSGSVPEDERVEVLKLNRNLTFRTGIYPYSVMTSVFAPVDGAEPERFSPTKISFTAQEWCGQVFRMLLPRSGAVRDELHSYFQSEGDRSETIDLPADTLYEDALWIQLRELDGPFAGGGDWSGRLVPSSWSMRKSHRPLRAVRATIRRADAERDGTPVTRFTIEYEGAAREIDVEKGEGHRILGWRGPGEEAGRLLATARLAYWELNAPGGERYLSRIGMGDEP